MQLQLEDKALPNPFFVLRGHNSEVQCLKFVTLKLEIASQLDQDTYIISGDAEGYIILWSLTTFRPIAIWKAHTAAILTVHVCNNQVITHGRDNKLHLWEIIDMDAMDKKLPLPSFNAGAASSDMQYQLPFMICSLDVNSLNFCQASFFTQTKPKSEELEIIVAVPGLIGNDYIDIYALPSGYRLATRIIAPTPTKGKLGNVMALDLQYPLLAAGYENGGTALFELDLSLVDRSTQKQDGKWLHRQSWLAHRDAVLSVVLDTLSNRIVSCGIDSKLVTYPFSDMGSASSAVSPYSAVETRHSGQQSLQMRSDGKLLGSGGWDSKARIFTTSKKKQVAVLSFHKAAVNAFAFRKKVTQDEEGMVALGSKDSKISLWKLY